AARPRSRSESRECGDRQRGPVDAGQVSPEPDPGAQAPGTGAPDPHPRRSSPGAPPDPGKLPEDARPSAVGDLQRGPPGARPGEGQPQVLPAVSRRDRFVLRGEP